MKKWNTLILDTSTCVLYVARSRNKWIYNVLVYRNGDLIVTCINIHITIYFSVNATRLAVSGYNLSCSRDS